MFLGEQDGSVEEPATFPTGHVASRILGVGEWKLSFSQAKTQKEKIINVGSFTN